MLTLYIKWQAGSSLNWSPKSIFDFANSLFYYKRAGTFYYKYKENWCEKTKTNPGEIIMLRWMCSHTKKDIIQYCIQGDINMAPIKEKMIENQFN